MVKRIMGTTLEGCRCTPQEWQWTESEEVEELGENYDGDIMQWLEDNIIDWSDVVISDEFNGRIHWLRDGIVLCHADGSGPCEMYWVEEKPARISIDNGRYWYDTDEVCDEFLDAAEKKGVHWEAIVNAMDPEIMEQAHRELAPCSSERFLRRYLELATFDLCIG